MANLERIYTIPLGHIYEIVRQKRGKRAISFIKAFALRHMKADEVKISQGLNSLVLRDGIQKPPRRVKVRIVKDEKGMAKVWLIGEEEKKKEMAEKKKKVDEAKKEQEKKAEESKKKEEAAKKEAQKPSAAAPAQKPAPQPQAAPAKK